MTNEWLAAKLGTRQWVVATRLTPRLRSRGYDVALTPARYHALQLEWERETYGATLAALEKAGPEMLRALRNLTNAANQRELDPLVMFVCIEQARAAIAAATA